MRALSRSLFAELFCALVFAFVCALVFALAGADVCAEIGTDNSAAIASRAPKSKGRGIEALNKSSSYGKGNQHQKLYHLLRETGVMCFFYGVVG